MKRRLEIARGLLHRPDVLFLDEPTLGLDPQTRRRVWDYLADLRSRHDLTIFLTTHYMDEAENCDRIAIIDHGRIVALDAPAQLKRDVGGDLITITTPDGHAAAAEIRHSYRQMAPGVNLIRFMYPGIIAMAVLTSALAAGLSVVSDREVGFLREILVAPISRTGIVLGKAIGAAVVGLLQALLRLAIAPLVGVDLNVGIVLRLVRS
jgi:ABC-type methionine transport system ATPase subunit